MPTSYKLKAATQIETSKPKIQVIITRGPFYFTHSAIRIQSNDKIYFWDPSGAYGMDEYAEYFSDNPLPENFSKREDLITAGIPSLETYWLFAQYTEDRSMEVFEWTLTNEQALHYQSILLAGSLDGNNEFDFDSHATFLLCSSALSRYLIDFVSEPVSLKETFFFPDSLAHKLYALRPNRIIIFDKGMPTQIFSPQNFE